MLRLKGRDYVIPDDVKRLVVATIAHRLILAPGAEIEGLSADGVLTQIVNQHPVPR